MCRPRNSVCFFVVTVVVVVVVFGPAGRGLIFSPLILFWGGAGRGVLETIRNFLDFAPIPSSP